MILRTAAVVGALALAVAGCTSLGGDEPAVTVAGQLDNRKGLSLGGAANLSDDRTLDRQLDDAVRLGAGWVRVDVQWSTVERTRGELDWSQPARVIAKARQRGLAVLAMIGYAPQWARNRDCSADPMCEPADSAAYAEFAEAAVRRFAPDDVLVYEVWNEPNATAFWKPRANPPLYADLLRQSYRRMKSADPRITVLAGATAPVGGKGDPGCDGSGGLFRTDGSMNALDFWERLYSNRIQGSFDALSHHPYDNRGFIPHRCSGWQQVAETSPSLRSLMGANGDGGKQVWATEYGNDAIIVGDEVKAERLVEAFDRWLDQPWSAGLMYYTYRDEACCEGYRLVREDGSRTAAWHAYKNYPRQ